MLNDFFIKDISVTIITKDASKYLNKCLQALKLFSEVIVIDNGSTDNTLEIAARFENVTLLEHDFIGFGPLKKLATTYAKNDWILSIDSDEIIPEDLVKYLHDLKLDKECVYTLRRLNHYNGRPIKGAGWYPDKVKRLFNRSETKFNDNMVHESVVSLKVKNIPLDIKHYTCENVSQMLQKMDKYTTIYANSKKKTTFFKAYTDVKMGIY
jgi:glycosyltransferase involved in cell wall biosynthesis